MWKKETPVYIQIVYVQNHLMSNMFDIEGTSRDNGNKLGYWRENLIGSIWKAQKS